MATYIIAIITIAMIIPALCTHGLVTIFTRYEIIEVKEVYINNEENKFIISIYYQNIGSIFTIIDSILINDIIYKSYRPSIELGGHFSILPSFCETGSIKIGIIVIQAGTIDPGGKRLIKGTVISIKIHTIGNKSFEAIVTLQSDPGSNNISKPPPNDNSTSSEIPIPPIITYFECTFSNESPHPYALGDYWPEHEPVYYLCEKGTWHWMDVRNYVDGTIYNPNNGRMRLINDPTDTTRLCLEMILDAAGTRPLPTDQNCKLYEIQRRNAKNYVEPYPTLKEAYYYMEVWVPQEFQVAPKSWRLIWQICGDEGVYGTPGFYGPELQLTFGDTSLYLINNHEWRSDGARYTIPIMSVPSFPKCRWVPIEVYAKQGTGFGSLDGTVIVWIDGVKVVERHNLATASKTGTPYFVWGIGNYGGKYEAQGQYFYFRNVKVTSGHTGY